VDRGAPIRANRVFAQFRKMCRWAVSRGIIERSPCEGMTAPSQETRRDRVLSDDEVGRAWRAFDKIGWPFGPIGKLLLLTGARRDEVASMCWGELDLARRTWTLPKERTKNKREHVVPLSVAALEVIESLPRIEGEARFVFTTTGRSAVSGFSRTKRSIDAAMRDPANGGPVHWTIHDLRRTVATNLQRLGVRLEPCSTTRAGAGPVSSASTSATSTLPRSGRRSTPGRGGSERSSSARLGAPPTLSSQGRSRGGEDDGASGRECDIKVLTKGALAPEHHPRQLRERRPEEADGEARGGGKVVTNVVRGAKFDFAIGIADDGMPPVRFVADIEGFKKKLRWADEEVTNRKGEPRARRTGRTRV
jgi:hypothetical protein